MWSAKNVDMTERSHIFASILFSVLSSTAEYTVWVILLALPFRAVRRMAEITHVMWFEHYPNLPWISRSMSAHVKGDRWWVWVVPHPPFQEFYKVGRLPIWIKNVAWGLSWEGEPLKLASLPCICTGDKIRVTTLISYQVLFKLLFCKS